MNFRILLLLITLSSCSKEAVETQTEETTSEESGLLGNWQWIKSTGGIAGLEINPSTEGVNKCLMIDDQYIRFTTNDTIQEEFEYNLALGNSIFSVDSVSLINLDGGIPYSYELQDFSLSLKEEIFDGYIHEYTRK